MKRRPLTVRRGFTAASGSRLFDDWPRASSSPFDSLRAAHTALRERSRDLFNNASFLKGFYRRLRRNVVGEAGIRLQARLRLPGGDPDLAGNQEVERAFARWGRLGSCTVCGRHSWRDVQELLAQGLARDGEILVRFVSGAAAGNEFGFALQLLEPEHLDGSYDAVVDRNGVRVRMGIELSPWGRPVAYHVLSDHPSGVAVMRRERMRLPARDVLHAFQADYVSQIRGIPWVHAAMGDARMVEKYREAELVAARIGASKGAYKKLSADSQEYSGEDDGPDGPEDVIEPGMMGILQPGEEVIPFNLDHPNTGFADFEKAILRGIASGLGVSYIGLANDLSETNYSSARQALIDERDEYRSIQGWIIEHVMVPIYQAWLAHAVLRGRVPNRSLEDLENVRWQGRGWQWIDPAKEAQAAVTEINEGLGTLTRTLAQRGIDIEDLLAERAAEEKLATAYGVSLRPQPSQPTNPEPATPPEDPDA